MRVSDEALQRTRDAALEAIVEKGPLNLRIAAAVALQNAVGGRVQSFPLLEKKLGDLSKHNITRNELAELHNKELSIQQKRQ